MVHTSTSPVAVPATPARPLVHGVLAFRLSLAWVVVTSAAAGLSLFVPDLLGGTAVGRGNLRGTAVVVLFVAVPLLVLGMARAAHGSARGLVLWLGASAYVVYQAVLFCFATPYNRLFPLYVASLGLGIWTLLVLLRQVSVTVFGGRVRPGMRHRLVAGVTAAFAALNGTAWLLRIVPSVTGDEPRSVLEGTGLLTNPVWVQDLAFWIPAALLVSAWLWQRRAEGVLLTGAMLTFYVLECLSIASDQWWGSRADDRFPDVASMSAVPLFLALAVLTALPLVGYYRHLDGPD